jgi:hypothetical protein
VRENPERGSGGDYLPQQALTQWGVWMKERKQREAFLRFSDTVRAANIDSQLRGQHAELTLRLTREAGVTLT